MGPLGGGHLGPEELESLLRSAGGSTVRLQVERLDVAYADTEACREADGALHWRPEAIYAIAST
jgi:hypothetical protein